MFGVLFAVLVMGVWLLTAMLRGGANEMPILPALGMIVAMIVAVMVLSPPSVDEWAAFKQEHSCRVVEKRDGQTTSGVGIGVANGLGVGVFSGSTPAQTAYVCDDGVTYWKNE